jgi:hypothetical protein
VETEAAGALTEGHEVGWEGAEGLVAGTAAAAVDWEAAAVVERAGPVATAAVVD